MRAKILANGDEIAYWEPVQDRAHPEAWWREVAPTGKLWLAFHISHKDIQELIKRFEVEAKKAGKAPKLVKEALEALRAFAA